MVFYHVIMPYGDLNIIAKYLLMRMAKVWKISQIHGKFDVNKIVFANEININRKLEEALATVCR